VPSLYPRRGVRRIEEDVADELVDAGSVSEPEDGFVPGTMPVRGVVAGTAADVAVAG